jgi:hypothetical protein
MTNFNEFIKEVAGRENNEDFLSDFAETELYFSIVSEHKNIPVGPLTTNLETSIKIRAVNLEGLKMALFFTSKGDSRLSSPFGGIKLTNAVKMVLKMPDIDGMLVQSDAEAWIAAENKALENAVGKYSHLPKRSKQS